MEKCASSKFSRRLGYAGGDEDSREIRAHAWPPHVFMRYPPRAVWRVYTIQRKQKEAGEGVCEFFRWFIAINAAYVRTYLASGKPEEGVRMSRLTQHILCSYETDV